MEEKMILILFVMLAAILIFTFGCLIGSEIVSHNPIYYCESCDDVTDTTFHKTSEYCSDCGSKYKIINQGEN